VDGWTIVLAATAALSLVLVSFWVVDGRMLPHGSRASTLLLNAGIALAGALPWLVLERLLVTGASGMLYLPVAVLGSVAAFIATIGVRTGGARAVSTLAFALVWSAAVFVPAAIVSFTRVGVFESIGIPPIDHGGSLGANVAAGAATFGVLLVSRASGRRLADIPFRVSVVAVALLCLAWLGWLVWSELAVDVATPGIVRNGLLGAAGGMVGWLVVQRIRHQATTVTAVGAGLVSGLIAVTAGAPLFTAVAAAVAGIIAGGAAALFAFDAVRRTRRPQWTIVATHLVAGGLGVMGLGFTAEGLGMFYDGQIDFAIAQIVSTLAVAGWSFVVAVLLWFIAVRPWARR
jgi:Amt family ammonium transporter